MRTTVELLRRVKARAAMNGLKLKDLIARYVEQGLEGSPSRGISSRRRSDLPVIRTATGHTLPALTNAEIQRILDEDAAAGGLGRSS